MTLSGRPKPRVIIIVGPTGVGKTEMAMQLAGRWKGEIISADSMQVYRGMDIGTAKPTVDQRRRIPHHLIDVVDPDGTFDASRYCGLARSVIARLHGEKKNVFVVGGTGLYVRALLGGLIVGPGRDDQLRRELWEEIERSGSAGLHGRLQDSDPRAAARINPHDRVRIIRALEVFELTGRSIVDHQEGHRFRERPYETLIIGLMLERERLRAGINLRTERMIADGFVEEVRGLLAEGFDRSLKSMQSLGYRHLVACLAGESTLEEAVCRIKRDTYRYARRQMTWFSTEKELVWHAPDDFTAAAERVGRFLGET
jgi:tRNA dimethylallyltransferase